VCDEVLFDEPGGRGEDARQQSGARVALGGLVTIQKARWPQIELVVLLYRFEEWFASS
jgi:hypothetical protein